MKTHFVPKGKMNTACGFGFRPWFDWFPAGGVEARSVTCEKCRARVKQMAFDISGVVQVGRPESWNQSGMKILVEEEGGRSQ